MLLSPGKSSTGPEKNTFCWDKRREREGGGEEKEVTSEKNMPLLPPFHQLESYISLFIIKSLKTHSSRNSLHFRSQSYDIKDNEL